MLAAHEERARHRIVGDALRDEQPIVDCPGDFARTDSPGAQRLECARGYLNTGIAGHAGEIRVVERAVVQRERRHVSQHAGGVRRLPVQCIRTREAAKKDRVRRTLRRDGLDLPQVLRIVLLLVRGQRCLIELAHSVSRHLLKSKGSARQRDRRRRYRDEDRGHNQEQAVEGEPDHAPDRRCQRHAHEARRRRERCVAH